MMNLSMLIVIILAIFAIFCMVKQSKYVKEDLSGYGTISGLAMNNDAKVCFKNIYDPESWPGYCSVIGKVVI